MSAHSRPHESSGLPPLPVGHAPHAERAEWVRHVEGMKTLADLAAGRCGEEGMRRHYLALMKLCAASMSERLQEPLQRPTASA